MACLDEREIRSVLMHFRGCSGEPNRTAGSYHSGHIADIELVINEVSRRNPDATVMAAGYSLGGNALLKYLAKRPDNPLAFAVSVCPPLVLTEGAKRLDSGFSKLYQRSLINQMKAAMRLKARRYPELELDRLNYEGVNNFVDFDHQITAPLHGFSSGEDYYDRASTLSDLRHLETPTHIIFTGNDPFFSQRCVPDDDDCLSPKVTFELVERAGHVAFISGNMPFFGRDWLRERVAELMQNRLSHLTEFQRKA
jgi:predicted alpha/beta-fold hydrolase